MSQHLNLIRQTVTGTPGTGNITLGAAVATYRPLAATVDGVATNGLLFDVEMFDSSTGERSVELGCVYNSGTNVLTRGTVASSTTGSRLSLTGAAVVSLVDHADLGNKLDEGFGGAVRAAPLNGVETPIADSPIVDGDSVLTGFRKIITRCADALDRSNHTGTQAISTVTGLQAAIDATAALDAAQTFTAAQRGSIVTLTSGATVTPDFALRNLFTLTLGTASMTLENPTNLVAGQSGCIFLVQDATGSRALAYGSFWDFAGGTAPVLSTAANSVDRLDYIVRTTGSIHAVLTKGWA